MIIPQCNAYNCSEIPPRDRENVLEYISDSCTCRQGHIMADPGWWGWGWGVLVLFRGPVHGLGCILTVTFICHARFTEHWNAHKTSKTAKQSWKRRSTRKACLFPHYQYEDSLLLLVLATTIILKCSVTINLHGRMKFSKKIPDNTPCDSCYLTWSSVSRANY